MATLSAPTLLTTAHDVSNFDCGQPSLNVWLAKKALKAQMVGGSARTYVACTVDHEVAGYYALATGAVARHEVLGKVRRNMPDPMPVIILARLAVAKPFTGAHLGAGLVKDALMRCVSAAEQIGVRAVVTHALDHTASRFYVKHGFYESPMDSHTLMLTIGEIETALGRV